jgi:predicted RNase H-like HicB family nuclease
MANIFERLFSSPIDPEALVALRYKMPVSLSVSIHKDPSGKYVAKINKFNSLSRPLTTQAQTGSELFEMVNDAVFTALDIPENYRPYMTAFFPPDEIRDQFAIKIPDKYLDKQLGLVKV